ncbi:sporulation protein [Marinomonas ushuaiensis DSM 15871]|uniref:Sporulation protein n=1 Tax=Marinomonas ushuaiensis DSM 15871 TaxID=1122207 RepID=X7E0N7_9GAMM|nr:AAA family ATPase [Marinomonas ushuaiensis]ETX09649.1 sporulation protein [Marinomonas ushuaiensis DSM 15871]
MPKPEFQFDLEEELNQPSKATLRDPFGSKDTSVYFASEEGNQQLALLEHLSRYSSLLSVVQGPQGSGKSRFMMEFDRHQDDTVIVSSVKASMLMTAGQLLQAIYAGFADHFKQPPNETTFGPLLKFSHDAEEKGRSTLVLVDNAQELNTDAVSMLLDMMSLATDNQTVPHIVLFSEYPLSRNLDAYQRSRYEQLSHSFTLAPYSLEQTRAYLLHRVRAVGGGINLPFDEKQIVQIHQESGGYPGQINQIAQAMMGSGDKFKKPGMRFNLAMGFPLAHMALLSVVMLGILVAVLFSDKSPDPAIDRANNVIPLSPRQGQSSPETIARIDAMQRKIGQEGEIVLPPIPTGSSLPPISTSNGASNRAPVGAEPSTTASNIGIVPTAPIRLAPIGLAPVGSEAPLVKTAPVFEAPEEAVKPPEENVAVTKDPADKTQWWLSQNPNRYTLQLLGTHNINAVKDFIRAQGSVEAFGYFKSKHKDRDWFVVVYGTYRNRSEAIAAAETLPSDIRALNPWARSARGIQDDINKAQ